MPIQPIKLLKLKANGLQTLHNIRSMGLIIGGILGLGYEEANYQCNFS